MVGDSIIIGVLEEGLSRGTCIGKVRTFHSKTVDDLFHHIIL